METDIRPWGHYEVLLDETNYKVKRITVNPGERLSYQYHVHRQESWVGVQGVGVLTLDGYEYPMRPGTELHIPYHTPHMIENPGEEPLIFIEIQTGTYFGEDDIVRLHDNYGRVDEEDEVDPEEEPSK